MCLDSDASCLRVYNHARQEEYVMEGLPPRVYLAPHFGPHTQQALTLTCSLAVLFGIFSLSPDVSVTLCLSFFPAFSPVFLTHTLPSLSRSRRIHFCPRVGISAHAATLTLTLSLARWFGPAVRVNTVCPGFIQTRWLLGALGQENYEKLRDAQEQTTPLRQAGTPEQMAEAVIFFLTSASNITGEFLIVDAGTHLGGLPMKGR